MENIRELRRRIRSVASTEQMVRAMKMVSVSKLRRSQSGLAGAKGYLACCASLMSDARRSAQTLPALMREPAGGIPCFVLLTGSRGLCGTYNQDVVSCFHAAAVKEREYAVVVCGRWGAENLDLSELPVDKVFADIGDTPTPEQCSEITQYLVDGYLSERFCRVEIVYQDFVNVLVRRPTRAVFLPAPDVVSGENMRDCLFEPDAAGVLESLTERYAHAYLYTVMLSAKISEHSARMTAMSAAADNAAEMKETLTRTLNRARQSAVTTEMLELAGGSTAGEP